MRKWSASTATYSSPAGCARPGERPLPVAGAGDRPGRPRRDGDRHYELLLRLYDPDGQMTPPGAFIPAAERFNLMASIDRWVINEALINFGARIAAVEGLSIGINLSGNSLNDPLFLPYLLDRIEHSPLRPERLYFELTETALMNQLSVASRIVAKLRDLGCKVALDDSAPA